MEQKALCYLHAAFFLCFCIASIRCQESDAGGQEAGGGIGFEAESSVHYSKNSDLRYKEFNPTEEVWEHATQSVPSEEKIPMSPESVEIEEMAREVVDDILLERKKDLFLKAIAEGDGRFLPYALELAAIKDPRAHRKFRRAIKSDLILAIKDAAISRNSISEFLYSALVSPEGDPADVSKILSSIIKDRGCQFVYHILRDAEHMSSYESNDDVFVTSIHKEDSLVSCLYTTCDNEPCCDVELFEVNFCKLCPLVGFCRYQRFGNGINSVLKSYSHQTQRMTKCSCPNEG